VAQSGILRNTVKSVQTKPVSPSTRTEAYTSVHFQAAEATASYLCDCCVLLFPNDVDLVKGLEAYRLSLRSTRERFVRVVRGDSEDSKELAKMLIKATISDDELRKSLENFLLKLTEPQKSTLFKRVMDTLFFSLSNSQS
jgi:hypothetical protein